jgi:hypothetical protein
MIFNYIIHSSHFTVCIEFVSFVTFNLIKGHIINNYKSILNKSDFFIKIIMKLFLKKKNLYYYINVYQLN